MTAFPGFRTPHRIILKKYDNDNDGRIDATEIQSVVDALMTEQFRSKAFKIGLIILTLFTIVLLGALFGLTWAVVAALKDTQVDGELLVTNDKARMPVMLANLEMTVGGGKLLTRDSMSPVTTSVVQSRGGVNVNTTFDKLLSMQSLVFAKTDGTSYTLSILGVARIPRENASDGAILRFQTDAGTVYLEDGVWSVSNITGPLLENLFTQIDGRGRRLQTAPPNTCYLLCVLLTACGVWVLPKSFR
ncbi:hypothetical protein GPECTOR_3g312 [Gonium pectorale]|uniref:EF-hand domain-containing protein n=1 Tax=Gonium pectorale TaxID=33097 RepID=A0A150GZC7_GONPE|nr:hypothetical protein GPECTOR_3g312 [Gonium pectorale]|eukprot:KXZ55165.1 hypothetical protein GPECTOR_3g312 [Gonium pectorale]